jgi:hypothetical protein
MAKPATVPRGIQVESSVEVSTAYDVIGRPPSSMGADHVTERLALPADVESERGAAGTVRVRGAYVVALDAHGPAPSTFTARTRIRYDVPFARLVILLLVDAVVSSPAQVLSSEVCSTS